MRDQWSTIRLGDVLSIDNEKLGNHAVEPSVFSLSKYDGVVLASEYFDKRIASADLEGYKVLKPDEWAYSTIHIDEGSIARNRTGLTGVLSPMYTTLTWFGKDQEPGFFELLLRSPTMLETYRSNAQGTVNRRRSLPYQAFAQIQIDVPPLLEQRRIVDLIEVIDERLGATDEVARRARESANAARSELIDWTQSLRPLGEVAMIESKLVNPTLDEYRNLPHIGVDKIVSSEGTLLPLLSAEQDGVTSGKHLFDSRDVIYSKIRPELRKAAFPASSGLCSADAYPLRPCAELIPEYLLEVLLSDSFTQRSVAKSGLTKMPKINRRELFDIEIPVPALEKQHQVADFIGMLRDVGIAAHASQEALSEVRYALLTSLLSGHLEIPNSYDALLGGPHDRAR